MKDPKLEPSLTKHELQPRENELAWRDEHVHPHVADLAEERAIQANKAKRGAQDGLPLSAVRLPPD